MTEKKVFTLCNFKTHQSDYVAPRVEEKLRAEIGASLPLVYQIQGAQSAKATAGTVMADAARLLVGGSGNTLFTLHFSPDQPRSFQLLVKINRGGVGSFIGGLLYSIQLNKFIAGEVSLEKPKMFGNSKFSGQPQVSEQLNQQDELLKQANKFSRTRIGYSGINVEIPRYFRIVPNERGSLLVIGTLPKPGLSNCLLNAKEFLDLATKIETTVLPHNGVKGAL